MEDSALIGVMISGIVKLAVFVPFKFLGQRDHMINLNCFFSRSKPKILSAFLTSKS